MEASHSRLPTTKNNIWVIYGKIALGKKEREAIETGKYLGDIHLTMAQRLMKDQFPSIKNGLQCTLYQEKSPIGHKNALQVVHTGGNHWSLISTMGCEESGYMIQYILQLMKAQLKL